MSWDMGLTLRSSAIGRALCFGCASSSCVARSGGLEDFAGGEVGDGDLVVVGEREDAFAGVDGADAEVVHSAGAADGSSCLWCRAGRSGGGSGLGGWPLLAGRLSGWRGRRRLGCAVEGAVGALLVVVLLELVQLALELGDGRAAGRAASQRCRVWWNRSVLPWVWGWPGDPFFWRMPSSARTYSNALRPPVNREV